MINLKPHSTWLEQSRTLSDMSLHVQIITPQKTVFEADADSVIIPSMEGELTVLTHHVPLFTPLVDGIVELKTEKNDYFFSIGGGYLETDGKKAIILVSRASGQDEVDEKEVKLAEERARKMVVEAKTDEERQQAMESLRRSTIDIKLLQKVRRKH